MKKKCEWWVSSWRDLKKLMLMTKLTTFLVLVFSVNAVASVYSQSTKLNLNMEQASIKEVLQQIESQSDFRFIYENEKLNMDKKVSIRMNNESVDGVLKKLFEGERVSYSITASNLIIIKPSGGLSANENLAQQQRTISGKVTDSSGEPLPGVTVLVKGTTQGTITDFDGNYTISDVPISGTLVFSFVGMKSQEIPVNGKLTIDVVLVEESVGIEEVVAVGYGVQKRVNLAGSVSSVNADDLVKAPIANTTNTLAGRLPGLVSLQSNGQPGADAAKLSIRGFGDALVIVDGIESDFKYIDPNQIESISILKDASASIYGARAGNGVILITTKRGETSKPVLNLNLSQTFQGITTMPKPVNSGQYAELTREQWIQSGQPEESSPFTQEDVEKYYNSNDPYLYPNTDWYNELFRKWSPQQQYNLSVRGGSEKIKYYGFLGYLDQSTVFKTNGGDYKRYNFQSNIDAKILDNLSLSLTIASIVQDRNFPQESISSGEASAWGWFWSTLPIYPAHLPDPTMVSYANGAGTGGAHIISNRELAGYSDTDTQNNNGTIELKYDFKFIKGLSAKLFANYSNYNSDNKSFRKTVHQYVYDPESDIYSLRGTFNADPELIQRHDKGRTITEQFSLYYDRTFDKHHVSALTLYEAIDSKSDYFLTGRKGFITTAVDQLYAGSTSSISNDGRAYESGRTSYVSRLNYSYADRYLLEATFRADASDRFPSNSRWGYFPSVSLGWRISEESFMQGISFIDNLKLRGSYGVSGSDQVAGSVYRYLSGYSIASYPFLLGSGNQIGLQSIGLANKEITWETLKISNVGFDFSLLNSKLYGTLEGFYRKRSGILGTRSNSMPTTFGAVLPIENLNSQNSKGFEFELGTSGRANNLMWDVSGNISWSRAKWDYYDEPNYDDPDQERINKHSGNWTDRQFGYQVDGLFTSQAEIDALTYDYPTGNSLLRPGDIRIIDQNDDGIIDWKDQVEIGQGTVPHWMFGLNSNLKYKNFDLSVLFQGAFGHFSTIKYTQGSNFPEFVYDGRWTEENNSKDALIPRLGGVTIGYFSAFNYKSAAYLRLKTLSFGYNLPKNWLHNIGINDIRLYMAGTNLLTFDKLKKYNLDPEAPSSQAGRYYPQQMTLSFGVNISF
mgnify:CR=1 FL=1|tara:strand:+ start:5421 stop:8813 length:3393 start_codon:yes stop_codon:yes gene_type:complete